MENEKALISQGLLYFTGLCRTIWWRPLPDLNRCRRRERAVSWAGLDEGDIQVIDLTLYYTKMDSSTFFSAII